MIRSLFIIISSCTLFLSCKKSDSGCNITDSTVTVPASEMTTLQTYVAANHPAAVQHSGGFYYEHITVGTGASATSLCSAVSVKYSGYLTNGTKFTTLPEEITGATYTLGGLIVGWQRGIPLAKVGGRIKLILPPSLAYGSSANGSVPANSTLIFYIDLVNVSNS